MTKMVQQKQHKKVALVMGVTGMAGVCIAETLKKPNVLGGPWKVYGVARRPKPTWFPSSAVDRYITFDALDLDDTEENLYPFVNEITHVFWVAVRVRPTEEENINVNFKMLLNVLNVLTLSPSSRLKHITLQSASKYYIGPFLEKAKATHIIPNKTPFREDMPRLLYPNFYYFVEDLLESFSSHLTWSVHRGTIMMGASTRSTYNTLLCFVVYASICRYDGTSFRFPGSKYQWESFTDISDARVIAEQQIWASMTNKAKNQAFNCTNGDIFTWRSFWKELSQLFDLDFVDEVESFDWLSEMRRKKKIWNAIVKEYGLYETNMEEILKCCEAVVVALNLKFQHVSSMTKSREFGFTGHTDSLKSLGIWVDKLREMKIIP